MDSVLKSHLFLLPKNVQLRPDLFCPGAQWARTPSAGQVFSLLLSTYHQCPQHSKNSRTPLLPPPGQGQRVHLSQRLCGIQQGKSKKIVVKAQVLESRRPGLANTKLCKFRQTIQLHCLSFISWKMGIVTCHCED